MTVFCSWFVVNHLEAFHELQPLCTTRALGKQPKLRMIEIKQLDVRRSLDEALGEPEEKSAAR